MSEPENVAGSERPVARKPKRRRRVLRIFFRILLVIGIIIVLGALYVLSFIMGKPKPTVDYLALLNEMTRVEGRSEADNGWADYERAFQLHQFDENDAVLRRVCNGSFRRFEDLNDVQKQATSAWIARNEEAWQTFARAANKPYFRKEYQYPVDPNESKGGNVKNESLLSLNVRERPELRRMALLGRWRIRAHLSQGHVQQALDDCVVLIKAGTQRNAMKSKILLDSLVNMAICIYGYDGLMAVLKQAGPSGIDLAGLERQLDGMRPDPESIIDLSEWRLANLDLIQRSFTSWGIGGGHLVINWRWPGDEPNMTSGENRFMVVGVAFLHARRDATVRKLESMYQQMNRTIQLTPYQFETSGYPKTYYSIPAAPNGWSNLVGLVCFSRYFLIEPYLPPIQRSIELAHRQRASHDAVVTVVAVKRYQADKGHCPDTLDELVRAGYLAYVPPDPYSDKPLVYRKTPEGFILYSVGWNMKDDGGRRSTSSDRHDQEWGSETDGDAILWPPQ